MRFYTLPDVDYPYLLVNRKNYRILFKRNFKHAIVDSGVMDFHNLSFFVVDYRIPWYLVSWNSFICILKLRAFIFSHDKFASSYFPII
jgi:hypothetical protein